MTNQTPDAAREDARLLAQWDEAEARRAHLEGIKDVVATIANALGASGTFTLESDESQTLDAYAAAVSRARDAAWRGAVEALKVNHRDGCDKCGAGGRDPLDCINESRAVFGNAALDALLSKMEATNG